jgi:sigma-B regulation protein RsbU (phosphoserine phosphatase)
MTTNDAYIPADPVNGPIENQGIEERVARSEATIRRLMHDLQQVILPIGVALSVEKDHRRLLERILEEAKQLCNADAATLYLRTDDNRLRFEIMRTDSLGIAFGGSAPQAVPHEPLPLYDEDGKPNEKNIASYVALHGKVVNVPDVYECEEFDFSKTKECDRNNHYRSVCTLTAPLKDPDGESIGVLQLFNAQDAATGEIVPFTEYQQLVFESLTSQAAIVLSNQSLIRHEQALLVYERELEIGRRIQQGFMPTELPQPEGWDIAAVFSPAHLVAGDFYDLFELEDGRIAFAVADVCDKGVGAALFGSLSRSLLRSFTQQCLPRGRSCDADCEVCPPQVMRDAVMEWAESHDVDLVNPLCAVNMTNSYILAVHRKANMFLTLFFGVLNPATGEIIYVNAGHEPAAVITADGERRVELPPTGPAVGIMLQAGLRAGQGMLQPGESLVIHTDGVTDARNENGEFFTPERLSGLLAKPSDTARGLLDRVVEAVHAHIGKADQFDDITMLVLRRSA